jgi:hypothetical protein
VTAGHKVGGTLVEFQRIRKKTRRKERKEKGKKKERR